MKSREDDGRYRYRVLGTVTSHCELRSCPSHTWAKIVRVFDYMLTPFIPIILSYQRALVLERIWVVIHRRFWCSLSYSTWSIVRKWLHQRQTYFMNWLIISLLRVVIECIIIQRKNYLSKVWSDRDKIDYITRAKKIIINLSLWTLQLKFFSFHVLLINEQF